MKKIIIIAALLLTANAVLASELLSKLNRCATVSVATETATENDYAKQQAAQELAQARVDNQF